MERITHVTRDTGRKCECASKGNILETFFKKYGKSNGVCGPGHFTPSWIESKSIGCEKCGRPYIFESMLDTTPEIKKELEYELSLSIDILQRPITVDDLPNVQKYSKRAKRNGTGSTLTPYWKKPKTVPPALKKLQVGTMVYILPSQDAYSDPHNPYVSIKFSIHKDALSYQVHNSCFK